MVSKGCVLFPASRTDRTLQWDTVKGVCNHVADELKDKRILIVDDDPDIRTSIHAAFEPTGATIDIADSGNLAVELAEKNNPDLIVLDMMLPGRSGFLVLEHIQRGKIKAKKTKHSEPFVIMITGNQGGRHKTYAESQGASVYLNKPVSMPKLLAEAKRLLGAAGAPAQPAPVR